MWALFVAGFVLAEIVLVVSLCLSDHGEPRTR